MAAALRNASKLSVFVPMLMLDRRPWIDNVSCAELAKRFRRPMPQDQSKIFHSLQDQAGIDTSGPPDDSDAANTRSLKTLALGFTHSTAESRSI